MGNGNGINSMGVQNDLRGTFQNPPTSNKRVRESGQYIEPDYRQLYLNDPALQGLVVHPGIDPAVYYAINRPIVDIKAGESFLTTAEPDAFAAVFPISPRRITIGNQGPGKLFVTLNGTDPVVAVPDVTGMKSNNTARIIAGTSFTWENLRMPMTIRPGFTQPVFVCAIRAGVDNCTFTFSFEFTEVVGGQLNSSSGQF